MLPRCCVLRQSIGVMKLLGHRSPAMTLLYLEIPQPDLQREYHLARSHPRHLLPTPPALRSSSQSHADLPGLLLSLDVAQHILEMFRRALPNGSERRLLARIGNRIAKIIAQLRPLNLPPK